MSLAGVAHPSTKVTSVSDGRPLFIVAVTDFVRLHESGLTRSWRSRTCAGVGRMGRGI